ncbi:MAG: NAD(P)-binding domain-containing protein [Kiloniellales bacterium]
MLRLIARYTRWLHTGWPAGHIEKLPLANEDGSTNVPGLYLVGDITGIPLLKFSSDTGARAVRTIAGDPAFQNRDTNAQRHGRPVLDLVIVGSGVSGLAAAMEARKLKLRFELLEANEPLSTIVNFPKGKPIYTYPTEMRPAGDLQFTGKSDIKEGLINELRDYMKRHGIEPTAARAVRARRTAGVLEVVVTDGDPRYAHRVIVAIGRSGNYRKLGIPGEDREMVYNRLLDPQDFCGKNIVVVGGGDSALETAIALTSCGTKVTLSYRGSVFSRPKPDNIDKIKQLVRQADAVVDVEEPTSEWVAPASGPFIPTRAAEEECEGCGKKLKGMPAQGDCPGCGKPYQRRLGSLRLLMSSRPKAIGDGEIVITNAEGTDETIKADAVFVMIGREAPLDFFRRSGVRIRGEWRPGIVLGLIGFVAFCFWLYHWKSGKPVPLVGDLPGWLDPDPARLWAWIESAGGSVAQWAGDPATLLGTVRLSSSGPSFYYTLAYSLVIVIFGIRRIRRRRTPYVTVQTYTLMTIQCLPLFLLPEIVLPWLGHHGFFNDGVVGSLADQLFPLVDYGHGREYWRAYGLILAWPLFVYNFFTEAPLWGWLVIGSIQTFVIIPLIIRRWGKGAYCGWICSCGALAETLGDTQRHKMPHGPTWNRLNMLGQVILLIAVVLFVLRVLGWIWSGSWADWMFDVGFGRIPALNYAWTVDLLLAGVLGYGLYFWFSGRMWCRFACPLAALMHIYARFSQFRIIADKKKCISCNVCTSVCHQGIDVMNFANKGIPMEDPQCVRCSACVQSCPTGVLEFGRVDRTGRVLGKDKLAASPVLMAEVTIEGKQPRAR